MVFLCTIPLVQAQVPFTITVTPSQIVLGTQSGTSDRFGVVVFAGQGFNGTVLLQVSGVPNGVNAVFDTPAAYITSLQVFSTYLTLTCSGNATEGTNVLTISGSSEQPSGVYVVSNQVTLMVQQHGEPRNLSSQANMTQPQFEESYVIAVTIVGVVAGFSLGSIVTYILVCKRGKRLKK